MEVYVSSKNSNKQSGFSLIEVLMAITLFAFLAVGMLTMTSMGISTNSYTQHHTKAVQLAESGLELLRRVNYNTELGAYNGLLNDFGTLPQYPDFRRRFAVTFATGICTLQVTVDWTLSINRLGVRKISLPIVLTTQRVAP